MTAVRKNDFCGIVKVCLICTMYRYTHKHVQGGREREREWGEERERAGEKERNKI